MRHLRIICLLYSIALTLASGLKAQCPSGSYGNVDLLPLKTTYCKGDSITFKLIHTYSLTGLVTWSYTGSFAGYAKSGVYDEIKYGYRLGTGGRMVATGTMDISGQACPFTISADITMSDLTADAGSNLFYQPGYTPHLTIGTATCEHLGSPAYTQTWTPATFISGSANGCTVIVDGQTSNTTYTLTVTDSIGCTNSSQMTVNIACPPSGSFGSISTSPTKTVYCPGDNLTGSLSISNTSFTLVGNPSWGFTGTPTLTPSGSNYTISTVASSGTIIATATVQMAAGTLTCPSTTKKFISVSGLHVNAGADLSYTPGLSAVNIGTSSCASNGSPSYSYTWTPSTHISGSVNNCTAQVSGLTSNMVYTLTAKDQYCTISDQMSVSLVCPTHFTGAISLSSGQPLYCHGSTVSGSFSITNSAFSYSAAVNWSASGGNTISSSGTHSVNFSIGSLNASGVAAANGSLQVTGGTLLCPFTATSQIVHTTLHADAGGPQVLDPSGTPVIIGSNSCTIGGNPGYSISWSPTTGFTGGSTICTPTVSGLTSPTEYFLTVSDTYCTDTDSMMVYLADHPGTVLKKTLDGGYYEIGSDDILYFKYDGEYNSGYLDYKIYDDQNGVVCDNCQSLTKIYGDNRYTLSIAAMSLTSGYYYMEVTNEKKELFKLKFKY